MRPVVSLLVVCLALTSVGQGHAQGIDRCEELYVDASFDAARRCVDTALGDLAEQPGAIRDAYALLAATELAAEREPAARRAVEVALAIDPGFAPANPLLRAPRVLSLFREVGSRSRSGIPPRAIFPESATLASAREVRVTARVQGVVPPLEVAVRHRVLGRDGRGALRESTLVAVDAGAGTMAATIRPPAEATSVETELVVQTPDRVPVLRVPGPTLTRAAPPPPDRPGPRARPSSTAAPAPAAPPSADTEPGVDGGIVAVWSTLGVVTALVTVLIATDQIEPLIRIRL